LWKATFVGERFGGNLRSVSAGRTRAAPGGSDEIARAERNVSDKSLTLTKLRPWLMRHSPQPVKKILTKYKKVLV
jgi:hypothetical protein